MSFLCKQERRRTSQLVYYQVPEQMISFAGIPMQEEWCLEPETMYLTFRDPFSFSLMHHVGHASYYHCVLLFFLILGNTSYKRDTFPTVMMAPSAAVSFLDVMSACNTLWSRSGCYSTRQLRHEEGVDHLHKGAQLPGAGLGIPTQASGARKEWNSNPMPYSQT